MWVKHLELTNFQKHERFETDFVNGVNVLVGETDAGKSCIVRALKWVMFSEPKGDVVRKTGTSKTSVEITLDNDVKLRKTKSDKENSYTITRDGESHKYDAVGKGVPDAVVNLLGVFPMEVDKDSIILNVAPQISLPFLLNESGVFRMKVLNKLTGNDILDRVSQSFNRDILGLKKELKIREEDEREKTGQVEEVERELKAKQKILRRVSAAFETIREKTDAFYAVKGIVERLKTLDRAIYDEGAKLKNIRHPSPETVKSLKERAVDFESAVELRGDIKIARQEVEVIRSKIKEVKIPTGISALKERAELFENVKRLGGLIKSSKSKESQTTVIIEDMGEFLKNQARDYKQILKQYGRCPTCHSQITEAVLESISL